MKQKALTNTEDSAGIKKLVNEIRKEQQKIDRYEGDVVASHIRLGNHLADLRALAKKTWAKQLKAIGMNPRVASRYLKIAQGWPTEIGLIESDLLPRLPPDLLKLEWLCRVPQAELGNLLDATDCKKATRSQVIAAVREALGEDPPVKKEQDVEKFVERCIHRLVNAVDRLSETFPQADQQTQARDLLATGLRQVLDSLQT
jgi:molecular chaperone GrpE (heat shock protein)